MFGQGPDRHQREFYRQEAKKSAEKKRDQIFVTALSKRPAPKKSGRRIRSTT